MRVPKGLKDTPAAVQIAPDLSNIPRREVLVRLAMIDGKPYFWMTGCDVGPDGPGPLDTPLQIETLCAVVSEVSKHLCSKVAEAEGAPQKPKSHLMMVQNGRPMQA